MDIWTKIKERRMLSLAALLGVCLLVGVIAQMREGFEAVGQGAKPVVVIDPGHGGIDPGKVGVNGAYEKDINLGISLYLKEILDKRGFQVIMTRESDCGLYQESDRNKKAADLRARADLMNQDEVSLVVSVHQNSFSGQSTRGAQVFYHAGSEEGQKLAAVLQAELIRSLDTSNHRQPKGNADYYLLRNTAKTAVIVECGFLSNPEEAEKLCDKSYQQQTAEAIAEGICQYLGIGQQ